MSKKKAKTKTKIEKEKEKETETTLLFNNTRPRKEEKFKEENRLSNDPDDLKALAWLKEHLTMDKLDTIDPHLVDVLKSLKKLWKIAEQETPKPKAPTKGPTQKK